MDIIRVRYEKEIGEGLASPLHFDDNSGRVTKFLLCMILTVSLHMHVYFLIFNRE